ncbi:MAG: type I-C CRISPR-associated protein Cas7/Csd2 [Clostridiales bacterium]|nr:type I-C CRISPR-associated protein Cas7/Csd2 [Clostridiales bacterium]
MSVLQHKIDFVALLSVTMANANGDPLNGNSPRTDYNGYGEMSDVCIKRKIRNRMQDLGNPIFVQSEERCDDGCASLSERASKLLGKMTDREASARKACETWLDVRSFGQVFAFKDSKGKDAKGKETKGVSVGVRGPVSIHQAVSVSPIQVADMQITKSVNGDKSEKLSSDRMGMKHFVRFGLYKVKGSINVQLAEKTGFTQADAETVKECLRTLFVNDASSARPDGSMEVVRLYWWEHNCKDGQYSSARVHRSVKVTQKDPSALPTSVEDYEITLDTLPGLEPEVIDGV